MTDETAKAPAVPVTPPVVRDEKGRFPAGVSGNPAGRTKGTKNEITLARLLLEKELREALTKKGPKLMHKAIRMALKGDDKIMRVLLDKMLATPRTDDDGATEDRDIQVVINNFTDPKAAKGRTIEGQVIRINLPTESTQMSKASNQHGQDNVPSITEKSSGLSPLLANLEPRQDKKVESREPSSKNDKG